MNNWINSPANPSNPTSPMNPSNPNQPVNSSSESISQAIEFNSWIDYVVVYGFFWCHGTIFYRCINSINKNSDRPL